MESDGVHMFRPDLGYKMCKMNISVKQQMTVNLMAGISDDDLIR
jgi:hypothetical protein